jgi:hypothetical protein
MSCSYGVARITGMALACTGLTTAFGSHVRKENSRCSPVTGSFFVPRVPVHGRQMPAKAPVGSASPRANHRMLFGVVSVHSLNEVKGTKQRHSGFSHPRQ